MSNNKIYFIDSHSVRLPAHLIARSFHTFINARLTQHTIESVEKQTKETTNSKSQHISTSIDGFCVCAMRFARAKNEFKSNRNVCRYFNGSQSLLKIRQKFPINLLCPKNKRFLFSISSSSSIRTKIRNLLLTFHFWNLWANRFVSQFDSL